MDPNEIAAYLVALADQWWKPLSDRQARALARRAGVRLPRAGYEVRLTNEAKLYLANRRHPQFGVFDQTGSHNYELRRY